MAMTELEKLDAGLPYDFMDPEVDGRKLHALSCAQKLNSDAERCGTRSGCP